MSWIQSSYCDNNACVQWAKSSYCGSNACVEVAQDTEIGVLRDSKDPEGPVLMFPRQAVREFLTGVKAGDFNR